MKIAIQEFNSFSKNQNTKNDQNVPKKLPSRPHSISISKFKSNI